MSEKYWLIRGDEKTPSRIMSSLGLFQGFTAEEEELLVQGSSLAAGDEPRIIDEHFAQSRQAALSQPARLLGFLQLKYDKYVKLEYAELEPTIKWFEWMSGAAVKPSAALYWKAMADYARWIGFGTSRADALELVGTLYPMTILCKVALATEAEGDVQQHYPPASCLESNGCVSCQIGASGLCNGTVEYDFLERIMVAMSKSEVSQEKLLDKLRSCVDCN